MVNPVEQVIQLHPEAKKRIQSCMKKWHDRTSGLRQWPLIGSFEKAWLDEVENNIKHYKAKDTSKTREGKRAIEREVLMWFRMLKERSQQASKKTREVVERKQCPLVEEHDGASDQRTLAELTALQRPPPYMATPSAPPTYLSDKNASKAGQYPLSISGEGSHLSGAIAGELQGKFTITLEGEPGGKDPFSECTGRASQERRGSLESNGSVGTKALMNSEMSERASLKNMLSDAQDRVDYRRAEAGTRPTTPESLSGEPEGAKEVGRTEEKEDEYKRILEKLSKKQWREKLDESLQDRDEEGTLARNQKTGMEKETQEGGPTGSTFPPGAQNERTGGQTKDIISQLFRQSEETTRRLNASMQELKDSMERFREAANSRDPASGIARSTKPPGVASSVEQEYHWEMEEQIPTRTSTPRVSGAEKPGTEKTAGRPDSSGVMRLQLEGIIRPQECEDEEEEEEQAEWRPTTTRLPRQRRKWPEPTWTRDDGRLIKSQSANNEQPTQNEEIAGSSMCPIIAKGPNRIKCYVPWSFMDMVGLASKLPALTEGANRWITALEESTAGIQLALGDIKALLMHMAGKTVTEEVFAAAQLLAVVQGNAADHVGFGGHRNQIWAELRKQYPEKMDPTKLEGEKLTDGECPAKFLHNFQRKWKEETGEAWNANLTTQSLFKLMVKKAMPVEVQKKLDNVVGLTKMDWPLFTEHIVHHVEIHRKEKKDVEEQNKQLATKLTQLQLGEIAKHQKKDKEKARTQAPVITVASENNATQQGATAQAAVVAQTPTFVKPQAADEQPPPAGTPIIHVHVNAAEGTMARAKSNRGRGRGRPMSQSFDSPGGPSGRPMCYECGQLGHIKRDCPEIREKVETKWA